MERGRGDEERESEGSREDQKERDGTLVEDREREREREGKGRGREKGEEKRGRESRSERPMFARIFDGDLAAHSGGCFSMDGRSRRTNNEDERRERKQGFGTLETDLQSPL